MWSYSRLIIKYTREASPRWTDARLGSVHARGYRKIEAVNATVLPRGTIKCKSHLNEEKTLGADSMNQQQIRPSSTR